MNKRQEIIILIKKCYFVNGFNHFVDKYKCIMQLGDILAKAPQASRQREALRFPLFMLLLMITWRKSYELTKKEYRHG